MVDAKIRWDVGEEQIRAMARHIEKFGKEVGMSQKEVDELTDELKDFERKGSRHVKNVKNEFGNLNEMGKKVGATILAALAIDRLIDYQKQIIQIQVEYQKMAAVLETALGSKSAAVTAMAQIQNFAKRTPFQVNQLTDSYVKLVNRGLLPTNKELTAMGDFSAAAGKDLNQLVEAILDVSNTERWTELGLKVRSEGDKIMATFKGIEVEAERTEKGAMEMVKAFGEMEGVAGSMAGISKTIGGNISNMDDAFERLFKTIGDAEDGPMKAMVQGATDMANALADIVEPETEKTNRAVAELFNSMREEMAGTLETTDDYEKKIRELNDRFNTLKETWKSTVGPAFDLKVEIAATSQVIELLKKEMAGLGPQTKLTWDDIVITTEDASDKMRKAADTTAEDLEDWADRYNKSQTSVLDDVEELEKGMKKFWDEFDKGQQEWIRDSLEKDRAAWLDYLNFQEDLQSGLVSLFATAGQSIARIQQDRLYRQMDQLERHYQHELDLAGTNTAEKERIERDYNQKREELEQQAADRERRAFIFQQLAALGQVWVQTRLAIAKAIAISPITFGEPMATYARVSGAISAGVIAAQTIPAFAEGESYVDGPGGRKDDRILSRLSRGERVVDADANEQLGGRGTSNKQLVDAWKFYQSIPMQLRGDLLEASRHARPGEMDYDKLADKISKPITRELKRKSGAVYIDGVKQIAVDGQNRRKYVSGKLGVRL